MKRTFLALCTALTGLAACDDATAPASVLTTTETAPALNIDEQLPTLPTLVSLALAAPRVSDPSADAALLDALARWTRADRLSGSEAEAERRRAYRAAAGPLLRTLGEVRLLGFERQLSFWVRIGLSTSAVKDNAALRQTLLAARRSLDAAERSRGDGDSHGAVVETMAAADALRHATPEAVAQRLLRASRLALQAVANDGAADASRRERAERLLQGAQAALDAGDHELAIRRAYYAGQLLRGQ